MGSLYSRTSEMPFQALFGVSGGLELSQSLGHQIGGGESWGRTGVRAFVRPMLDLENIGTNRSAVALSAYSAIFTRININALFQQDLAGPLSLDFALEFSDRGTDPQPASLGRSQRPDPGLAGLAVARLAIRALIR